MNFRIVLKILSFVLSGICFTIVYLMYSNLSFIDTPYLVWGFILLFLGFVIKRRKEIQLVFKPASLYHFIFNFWRKN